MRKPILLLLFILALLLSACGRVAAASPETLVISKLLGTRSHTNPLSIQILQTHEFKQHVFVLVEYQARGQKGGWLDCSTLYDTFQDERGSWTAFGTRVNCSTQEKFSLKPGWTGGGTGSLANMPEDFVYSYIEGRAWNDSTVSVTITWADGIQQNAQVNRGGYLALREGKNSYRLVEEKDDTGAVLYTGEFTP